METKTHQVGPLKTDFLPPKNPNPICSNSFLNQKKPVLPTPSPAVNALYQCPDASINKLTEQYLYFS